MDVHAGQREDTSKDTESEEADTKAALRAEVGPPVIQERDRSRPHAIFGLLLLLPASSMSAFKKPRLQACSTIPFRQSRYSPAFRRMSRAIVNLIIQRLLIAT